jgi:hypothetical protein
MTWNWKHKSERSYGFPLHFKLCFHTFKIEVSKFSPKWSIWLPWYYPIRSKVGLQTTLFPKVKFHNSRHHWKMKIYGMQSLLELSTSQVSFLPKFIANIITTIFIYKADTETLQFLIWDPHLVPLVLNSRFVYTIIFYTTFILVWESDLLKKTNKSLKIGLNS